MTPHDNNGHRRPARLQAPMIVETTEDAALLRQALKGVKRLALDTESNSLHAYTPHVCLIQISTDWEDFLVDPLKLDMAHDGAFLGDLCADPEVEIAFHAAEYDIMMLRRDFGWTFHNLFDTMIGARVLGWEKVGLGNILEERYGVRVNKKHQRADWGHRPLDSELIRYAQMDTHYLLDLRDFLYEQLANGDHVAEAKELFDEVCLARWNGDDFDPDGFWTINKTRGLSGQEMAILRELYLYRDQKARDRDVPVFKVMGDHTLVTLAQEKPRSTHEVGHIHGISGWQEREYGRGIVEAIKRGLQAEPPQPPERNHNRPPDDVLRRYDALHTWRKERAAKRGVSSEIVVSKDTLWELARQAPATLDELAKLDSIGPWRTEFYGDEILDVLARVD